MWKIMLLKKPIHSIEYVSVTVYFLKKLMLKIEFLNGFLIEIP